MSVLHFATHEPAGAGHTDAEPNDTGVDPCAPVPGVGKVCFEFSAAMHPGYDITTGASAQKIDGAGKLKLYIFDKDPADPSVPYATFVDYPAMDELRIDSLPINVPVTVAPGKHWLIAQFEDNKNVARTGENYYLAGDFIASPSRNTSGRLVYPQFDVVAGETARPKITLAPMRRVDVDIQADATMRATYSEYAVPGDGPVVFVLFDGAFTGSTQFLEFVSTRCVQAAPMSLNPPSLKMGFATAVTGTHNIVASLEDYDSTKAFPTSGSLLTPSDGTIPTLAIVNTSWTTSTSLKFVKILNPFRATDPADMQKCP